MTVKRDGFAAEPDLSFVGVRLLGREGRWRARGQELADDGLIDSHAVDWRLRGIRKVPLSQRERHAAVILGVYREMNDHILAQRLNMTVNSVLRLRRRYNLPTVYTANKVKEAA